MVSHQALCQLCGILGKLESIPGAGNTVCTVCGTVMAENNLEAEIGFGETSSGQAIVQGSYVASNATGARMSRPGAQHSQLESREQTLANGRRACQNLCLAMHLPPNYADKAARYYTIAVVNNFTKGRKGTYVIASCMYIVCRLERNPAMLIDFSDRIAVNVFELGSTYLKLVRKIHMAGKIPLIDPSIYIHRFAALLEFGDDTGRVANDATRLVARFDRDWMQTGRRPSGICGACLIIAARMNNFRRSVAEVVQVVKIADVTLKKRLKEFQATQSGQLTIEEFRTVWLEDSEKPPAMINNERREKELERKRRLATTGAEDTDEDEDEDDEDASLVSKRKKGKRREDGTKRRRIRGGSSVAPSQAGSVPPNGRNRDRSTASATPGPSRLRAESSQPAPLEGRGSRAGSSVPPMTNNQAFSALGREIEIADGLRQGTPSESGSRRGGELGEEEEDYLAQLEELDKEEEEEEAGGSGAQDKEERDKEDEVDERVMDQAVQGEINNFLAKDQPALLLGEVHLAEQRRLSELQRRLEEEPDEDLQGLDEDELDAYLLDDESVRIKTLIWNKFNHDYMVQLNARNARKSGDHDTTRAPKKRAQRVGPAASASDAAMQLVRQKKFSRKLNYSNIAALLEDDDIDEPKLRRLSSMSAGPSGGEKSDGEKTDGDKSEGEKTDVDLGDDKSDDDEDIEHEPMEVVEEGNEVILPEETFDDDDDEPMSRHRMMAEDDDPYAEEI